MKNKTANERTNALFINVIFSGAGFATPDPGEAPLMAGFNIK